MDDVIEIPVTVNREMTLEDLTPTVPFATAHFSAPEIVTRDELNNILNNIVGRIHEIVKENISISEEEFFNILMEDNR